MSAQIEGIYAKIYRCVSCIPKGKVATYGQIAKLVDASGPRQVGYALSSTPPETNIPWYRVINARGQVSARSDGRADSEQYQRLLSEGVMANKQGRISLSLFRWEPSYEDFMLDEIDNDELWLDQPGIG